MRLTLRQLEVLVEIAHSRSATAAAEQLHMSQSAASAALAELESQLGERLFDRVGKRLVLNDAGRLLLPRAMAVLDQTRDIEHLFRDQASELHIGASTTVGGAIFPDILAAFSAAHPTVRVHLQVGNTQAIADAVAQFEVDLGLVEGSVHRDELELLPWIEDHMVVVCGAGCPHAGGPVPLQTLASARWLLREPGSGTRETVERLLLDHLHSFADTVVLGSNEAIRAAAIAGLGLACISRRLVSDALADGRLVALQSELPDLTRRLYLVRHQKKVFSRALEHFFEFCRNWPDDTPSPVSRSAPSAFSPSPR